MKTCLTVRVFAYLVTAIIAVLNTGRCHDLQVLEAWQKASVPTGREHVFLTRLESRLRKLLPPSGVTVETDTAGNLVVAFGKERGNTTAVTFACSVDEPTWVLSAKRKQAYFGVRPLFFHPRSNDAIPLWLNGGLWIIDRAGRRHAGTFAIPSIHLQRRRRTERWRTFQEKDLYVDAGDENDIDILDRVVKQRDLDRMPGGQWVGWELGRRVTCFSLYQLGIRLLQKGAGSQKRVRLVFLTQSLYGNRGLQAYVNRRHPRVMVMLEPSPHVKKITVQSMGGGSIPSDLKKWWTLLTPADSPVEGERDIRRLTYLSPAVKAWFDQAAWLRVLYPVVQPVQGVDAVPSDPKNPNSPPALIRRLVEWVEKLPGTSSRQF